MPSFVEVLPANWSGSNFIDLGPSPILWEIDFTAMALGNSPANIAAAKSLISAKATLVRASSATVRTSLSTVYTGFGVDDPRIGFDGTGPALCIEEARTNVQTYARDVVIGSGWVVGGAGTLTQNVEVGADGTGGAERYQLSAGNYGAYAGGFTVPSGQSITASLWVKRVAGTGSGTIQVALAQAGLSAGAAVVKVIGEAWERIELTTTNSGADAAYYLTPWEGRASVLGTTNIALDYLIDLVNVEQSAKFATEGIVTAGATATRTADRIYAPASQLVRSGSIGVELSIVPKCSSSNLAADNILYLNDASNYAYIRSATGGSPGRITVWNGGAAFTGTVQASYQAGDAVRFFSRQGNGAITVWYSVNGGAAVQLMSTTSANPFPATGNVDLSSGGVFGQHTSCWLRTARAYAPGRRPSWAA